MDVSIIIVNYNTKQLTLECINSIIKHTRNVVYEIILVDNASSDGSQELFERDTRVKFIKSASNLGFGKANNLGVLQSKGKYLFYLNSDTVLLNNVVKMLYDKMESVDETIGGIGTILIDKFGNSIHSYGRFPTKRFELNRQTFIGTILRKCGFKTSFYDYDDKRNCIFFQVDYITGADLFVRRVLVDKYGAFDKDFFMYYEESEMQYRYTRKGYKFFILRGPSIVHLEGASIKKAVSLRKRRIALAGCFLYHRKTSSSFTYFIFRVLFAILSLPMLLTCKYSIKDRIDYYREVCKL